MLKDGKAPREDGEWGQETDAAPVLGLDELTLHKDLNVLALHLQDLLAALARKVGAVLVQHADLGHLELVLQQRARKANVDGRVPLITRQDPDAEVSLWNASREKRKEKKSVPQTTDRHKRARRDRHTRCMVAIASGTPS